MVASGLIASAGVGTDRSSGGGDGLQRRWRGRILAAAAVQIAAAGSKEQIT